MGQRLQCWHVGRRQLCREGDRLQAGVKLKRPRLVGPIEKVPATVDTVIGMFGFFMVSQSELGIPILHSDTPRSVAQCSRGLCHTMRQTTMVFRWHLW